MKNKTVKLITASMIAATLCSMPVMAADTNDYILLLPNTTGITYEMDQTHVADQYSNDQYTVLLYKEGETVDLTVNGAEDFVIRDAMDSDNTDYAASETNGKVSFSMPAEDLSLNISGVTEEAKTAAETETETQAPETEAQTEAPAEAPAADAVQTEAPAEAPAADAVQTEAPADIKVASTRVNVRESADANANKIAVLTPSQRVRVLSEENGWTRLQFVKDGTLVEGSVKSDFLTGTDALYKATVNANVRATASDKAEKIGKAEKDSEVVVLEAGQDGWDKVRITVAGKSKDGFIRADLLTQKTAPEIDPLLTK